MPAITISRQDISDITLEKIDNIKRSVILKHKKLPKNFKEDILAICLHKAHSEKFQVNK